MLFPVDLLPDPYDNCVWLIDSPITVEEVEAAINKGYLLDVPTDVAFDRSFHVARVAYLVVHGWEDPIEVEASDHITWPVMDGNHRLAAAKFLGMEMVEVQFSGCSSLLEEWYGKAWAEAIECDWDKLLENDPIALDSSDSGPIL